MTYYIENGSQIPEAWTRHRVQKKTTMQRREVEGDSEEFEVWGGKQTAVRGVDYVLFSADISGYPCKKDIFEATYTETEPGSGYYYKTAITLIVQVPDGEFVTLKTLEGDEEVSSPDFIAIGSKDEVYVNKSEWVASNLRFLS